MRLDEIMTTDVRAVSPELPAEEAFELMRRERVRHLAVVERGQLVGVLSERDLGGRRGSTARANRLVVELMNDHAITATPRTTVREAANLLRGHIIGCLPVMDGRKVVGIVTTTDLLDLIGRGGGRQPATPQRWVMKGRGPRKRTAVVAQTASRARARRGTR